MYCFSRLTISLKINPSSLTDGVILYAAQNHQGIGQFMSLTLKNRQIEFRYTIGSMSRTSIVLRVICFHRARCAY